MSILLVLIGLLSGLILSIEGADKLGGYVQLATLAGAAVYFWP